jgi:hypothetical protein
MSYLIFPTEKDAMDRTRSAWGQRLGRAKRAADVTEYLWSVRVGKDGRAAVVVVGNEALLTSGESTAKVESLSTNWVVGL